MNTQHLGRRLLTASLVAAAVAPAPGIAGSPFDGHRLVDAAVLDSLRGGLEVAGLRMELNARLNTYIDERLALTTEANLANLEGIRQTAVDRANRRVEARLSSANEALVTASSSSTQRLEQMTSRSPSPARSVQPSVIADSPVPTPERGVRTNESPADMATTATRTAAPAIADNVTRETQAAAVNPPVRTPTAPTTPPPARRAALDGVTVASPSEGKGGSTPTTSRTAVTGMTSRGNNPAPSVGNQAIDNQRTPDTEAVATLRSAASADASRERAMGAETITGTTSVRHTITPRQIATTVMNTVDGRAIRSSVEVEVTVHNFSQFSAVARQSLAARRAALRISGF